MPRWGAKFASSEVRNSLTKILFKSAKLWIRLHPIHSDVNGSGYGSKKLVHRDHLPMMVVYFLPQFTSTSRYRCGWARSSGRSWRSSPGWRLIRQVRPTQCCGSIYVYVDPYADTTFCFMWIRMRIRLSELCGSGSDWIMWIRIQLKCISLLRTTIQRENWYSVASSISRDHTWC